jgi:hypothetical protein
MLRLFLVATGQSDWKEKHVEKMTGSLMEAFDEAESDHGVLHGNFGAYAMI